MVLKGFCKFGLPRIGSSMPAIKISSPFIWTGYASFLKNIVRCAHYFLIFSVPSHRDHDYRKRQTFQTVREMTKKSDHWIIFKNDKRLSTKSPEK